MDIAALNPSYELIAQIGGVSVRNSGSISTAAWRATRFIGIFSVRKPVVILAQVSESPDLKVITGLRARFQVIQEIFILIVTGLSWRGTIDALG
jgi:hypothetical protein